MNMKENKTLQKIFLVITLSIILIPLGLLIYFKSIDKNTWIEFLGGYLGSIISAIVAGGLAFYISHSESERQQSQLNQQLEAQKKIDIKVQSDFLKKQLIIEKKSKVLNTIMDLMNTLPKMHGYIISRIETDKEIKKNVYDDYVDEIQIIFIEINTTAAFIPKYKEKFVNLYLDYIQYEKNLRSLVVATIANNEELEKGKELVEANPEDLKDVAEELKVLADLRKKKGNRKSSRHLSETSFFIKSFLMSRDAVEQEYDELMDKSIELYQEVDNSLFNDVREL